MGARSLITDDLAYGTLGIDLRFLREITDRDVGHRRRGAVEFRIDRRHDAQQRRFPRPVRPEHADFGTREETQRDVFEDLTLGRDEFPDPMHLINVFRHSLTVIRGARSRPRLRPLAWRSRAGAEHSKRATSGRKTFRGRCTGIAPTLRRDLPSFDQQRLRDQTEASVRIAKPAFGMTDAARREARACVEVHPVAGRIAIERDGEARRDGEVVRQRELDADSVGRVGDDERARERVEADAIHEPWAGGNGRVDTSDPLQNRHSMAFP